MKRPAGLLPEVLVARSLLFVLPMSALLLALPQVPHWVVIALVVVLAGQWALSPDHLAGTLTLILVIGWWTARGSTDWRVMAVGVLLLTAHVVATVLAHGPGSMALDPALVRLWLRRTALCIVPMAAAFFAVRGLDPDLAPPWLWMSGAVALLALTLAATRLTQPETE